MIVLTLASVGLLIGLALFSVLFLFITLLPIYFTLKGK